MSAAALGACVNNVEEPMAKRMRAVFYLRTRGDRESVQHLARALMNAEDSALLRHELAYVLGQIGDAAVVPNLVQVLRDTADDVMVRHECAEALGAIGQEDSVGVLEAFLSDARPEVSETCELAIQRIRWANSADPAERSKAKAANPYASVDPAPPLPEDASVELLRSTLLDEKQPLFVRYQAMFSLRNVGTEEAVLALCDGFKASSALFRHEIAYVLGQMQHPASAKAMIEVLFDLREHPMVRHEAAEALGAIGTPECNDALQKHMSDESRVVKESCEVALDAMDYWGEVAATAASS